MECGASIYASHIVLYRHHMFQKILYFWRVPVLGGPKIVEKRQLVCQSSGFLLEFCRSFQYIFYVLTVKIHVQFCFFIRLMDIKFRENATRLLPGSYYYAGTTNIAFSPNLISMNHIKKQDCTCISTVNT